MSQSGTSRQIQILLLEDVRRVLLVDEEGKAGKRREKDSRRAARCGGDLRQISAKDMDGYLRNLLLPYKDWPARVLVAEAASWNVPLGMVIPIRAKA